MPDPRGNCPECGEQQPSGFQADGWVEICDREGNASYRPCAACRPRQFALWRERTSKRLDQRR